MMKKRLKNILTKSSKKNGLLLCICAICITLTSGMLIGCSAIKNDSPDESVQIETISPSLEDNTNIQVVQKIGHVLVLFKQADKRDNRSYSLEVTKL